MPTATVAVNASGEVFTHKILWSTCQRQLAVARATPTGSWHFYLASMTIGYMVFEAYINYVGTKLLPDLWLDERSSFATPPYKGTQGKLLKLCEHVGIPFPDKGQRPYQSLKVLKDLRDFIAHGKPETFEISETHRQDNIPSMIRYSLDAQVSATSAERTLSDLRALIETLHAKFVAFAGQDALLPVALDGMMAMSTWSANEP